MIDKKEDLFPTAEAPKKEIKALPKKGNPILVISLFLGALVLVIFVVRPAILGYGIYQEAQDSNLTVEEYAQNMQQLSRDLEVTKANLSSYSSFTGALIQQVDEKTDELTECKVQLERVQVEVEQLQKQVSEQETEIAIVRTDVQQIADEQVAEKTKALEEEKAACEESLSEKESTIGEIEAKYDSLVKNTAKSICCKAKVDNPEINFYDVVDNKISCLEQGQNQLNC